MRGIGNRPPATLLLIVVIGSVLSVAASMHAQEAEGVLEAWPPANHELLEASVENSVDARLIGPLLCPDCGVCLKPVYYGEVFTNTRGGISTRRATQYEALLDLRLNLDFAKMQLPPLGRFFLLGQNTHGRGLTENFVGDTQVLSNIDSFDNIMQVSE